MVPVNIACKRIGPWYSRLVLWQLLLPVEGRRSLRKTATMIEEPVPSVGRRTERLVSTNLAAGTTSWSAWFSGDIESSKYRILRKQVMRRCQDTGQERTPVARSNPRSCWTSVRAECHV